MKVAILLSLLTSVLLCNAQDDSDEGFCPIDRPKECAGEATPPDSTRGCFRAAVVEYNRVDLEDVKRTVEANLANFRNISRLAAERGAKLLVFPEDGLFIAKVREAVFDVLTEVPDPQLLGESDNNPCLHAPTADTSYILRDLSCMARQNNLYLVANFGTKEACEPQTKTGNLTCPDEGFFSFNTNVILDSKGRFVRRYRKYNTFLEIFHRAPKLELVHLDTPYGRFGIFTCFDLMFKSPAVDLVEDHHINTAIFPTWWYDELPVLSAIQFQDGWSWTNNVNLLSASIQRRHLGSTGCGIYSLNDTVYTGSGSKNSKLILANLPIHKGTQCDEGFEPEIVDLHDKDQEPSNYVHKHYDLLETDTIYELQDNEQVHTLCSERLCCTFDYKIQPPLSTDELSKLVLVIRDGLRPGRYEWYEQVCLLGTLESALERKSLATTRFSNEGRAKFERFSIRGQFDTRYVYPIAAYSVSNLISRDDRDHKCEQLEEATRTGLSNCSLGLLPSHKDETIYSFGLYARLYDSDKVIF